MPFSAEVKSTITGTPPSASPPINDYTEDLSARSAGAPHPVIHTGHETPTPASDAVRNVLTACWAEGVRNHTTGLSLSLRPSDEAQAQVEISRDKQQKRPDTSSVVQPAEAECIKNDTSGLLLKTGDQAKGSQRHAPKETR